MKTENGLLVKIEFTTTKGMAGWIEVSPDKWVDCKWDAKGKCLIGDLGSFYNLVVD